MTKTACGGIDKVPFTSVSNLSSALRTLKENGYLEFKENKNEYIINNNTIDSRTGYTYSYFKKLDISKKNLKSLIS